MATANTVPEEIEEEQTSPLPAESMRELVYGDEWSGDEAYQYDVSVARDVGGAW